jgi:alkylation response protein AidB-like acyl-CoA dehydrogenase
MNFELSQEQIMFRDMARKFAELEIIPRLKDHERLERIDTEITKKVAPLGLHGVLIPQQYGGLGLDYITFGIIWEQLSWGSWSMAQAALGGAILPRAVIMAGGNEEQKQKYLNSMAKGEKIFSMAAVEPNAGSDSSAIETTAKSTGKNWVLNGNKIFITNGSVADIILVLAQTDKSKGPRGLAIFVVERDTPGFSSTEIKGKLGFRSCSLSQLRFTDCEIPEENIIGEIGGGLRNTMQGVDDARFSIAAGCIGMSQSCFESCLKYVKERKQFGKPIGSFQLIQEKISKMGAQIDVMRTYLYYLGDLKNRRIPHVKETSYCKYLASEMAVRVSAEAIKIYGAYGCVDDYLIEHHYRDAMLATILGGTEEMHKLIIGRELLGINSLV